jgi:hypothetical protein
MYYTRSNLFRKVKIKIGQNSNRGKERVTELHRIGNNNNKNNNNNVISSVNNMVYEL